MLDKDKLIIVFHVGIGEMNKQKAIQTLMGFSNTIQTKFDESVKTIIIPDDTICQNVRVEVINPITLTENEYNGTVVPFVKQAEQAIKDFKENLENGNSN